MRLARFLAAICVAWAAVMSAFWNAGVSQEAAGLPRLIPDDPAIATGRALAAFDPAEAPSEKALAEVRKAARFDPLSAAPRLLLARARIAEGRSDEATRLLEDARRLNPRTRDTRLLLFQQYLLTNRTAGLIEETGALDSLMPQGRVWLVAMLAKMAANPDSRRETLAALPGHPLQIPVILKLSRDGAPVEDLLKASANLRGSAVEARARPWVVDVVMAFVGRGDMAGARRLWRHFYAVDAPGGSYAVPFDGTFAGVAGPPFGWEAMSGSAGISEIVDGALDIEFFGRRPVRLARQLIDLAPGDYRLRFEAVRTGGGSQSRLLWRITCPGPSTILRSPLDLSSGESEAYSSAVFSVPDAGCETQWLTLEGSPGIDAKPVSATIQSITIERL